MKKKDNNVIEKDLVLVGAGHSNIEVLKNFGNNPIKGIRVTLITNKLEATYSGMVPGYIEGIYNWNDIIIDLIKMSYHFDFRIIYSEATRIDGKRNKIYMQNRHPIDYDYLSINVGINSKRIKCIYNKNLLLALKPVSGIKSLVKKTIDSKKNNPKDILVIIGAGAAGVEVSIAFRKRFNKLNINNKILLISNKKYILENYNASVKKVFTKALEKNNIGILYDSNVTKITKKYIEINNKEKIFCTLPLLSTSSQPPDLLQNSNLTVNKRGYLQIENTLQLKNFNNIFASGDVAELSDHKNIKAGVFAVKQGKLLKRNIRSYISNKTLSSYFPQRFYLSLIGLGNQSALANKYFLNIEGKLLWNIKSFIDKRFIKKYSFFPYRKNKVSFKNNSSEPYDKEMQCEGCGNKIPQNVLVKVFNKNMLLGSPDAEKIPYSNNLFHTVDVISSIVKDPFLLGRIGAKHAINDLFAANAEPSVAQMIIGLPPAKSNINIRDLIQLKKGAQSIFDEFNCNISGGHSYSYEGNQIILGFSLVGKKKKREKMAAFNRGKIYVTGNIGSALVFAGIKEKKVQGIYYESVIKSMQLSNYKIHNILLENNICIKTDISGFGIAIHLHNLLLRYPFLKGADIFLDRIPLFKGASQALDKNITSSLNDANKNFIKDKIIIKNKNKNKNLINALYDPQTAGGFIFVNKDKNEKLIKKLLEQKIKFTHIGNINNDTNKINIL